MKRINYTFITGKIRYLETKLLNVVDLERMIDAPNLESAFKILYDTDYGAHLLERKPEEFEMVILDDLLEDKKLLWQFVFDKDLIKFLLLEYDFHNLKVIFKEKLYNKDLDYLLIPLGFFEPVIFKKVIIDKERIKIDKEFQEIIDEANNFLKPDLHPYQIEFFFDQKYFLLLKKLAEKLKNKFIIDFVNLKLDLTNLRIFLRIKNLKRDVDFLSQALVIPGKIDINDLINLYHQDIEKTLKYLVKFLPPYFEKYFSEYLKEKDLWLLEKRFFEAEIEYLRKAKYIAYGPEIVVAYFYAKKNANKNIRLIMSGKLNKIENEILKGKIRALY
ncbi:MAG: V-type ATPase subunit [Patescibacteria group bacterium]